MSLGAGAGGERAVVAVEVGAVVHEALVLLDPGVAGAEGGLRGAARDADVAVSEWRRTATSHCSSVCGRWRQTPVTTSVLALVFQKSATPRARSRSLMSLRHCFFCGVERASGHRLSSG